MMSKGATCLTGVTDRMRYTLESGEIPAMVINDIADFIQRASK